LAGEKSNRLFHAKEDSLKRLPCVIGILLGVLGMVLCLAALVAVWASYPRWERTIQEAHQEIASALDQVKGRIAITRERVRTASELTATFRSRLKEWATAEDQDPDHAGQRAELISARLHQARDGLDLARSFLERARSAERLAHPFRGKSESSPIDELLKQLEILHDHVSRLVDSVDEIRQQFKESGNEGQLEQTIAHATEEVVYVLEVVDSLDDRIALLETRVSEIQAQAQELDLEIERWLWWGRLLASACLPWMAVGQVALVVLCWRRLKKESS
jgi:biopolymer transport protein ExbB/TolQ